MRVGQAGGYGAAFTLMQSLGLLPAMATTGEKVVLRKVPGNGTTVLILGGGIAGLVSAYELGKLGYRCTLLEARETRVGGRNWTVRQGTKVDFTDGFSQTCTFEDGNYQNVGPARLPSIHTIMLGYCKELGVPLEVEINTSRCALMQADHMNGGKAVQQRQMVNDTRGHVSELLAKAVNQGSLDQDLSQEDKEKMLEFLRQYGDLTKDYRFQGTQRSGFTIPPGAGKQDPTPIEPLPWHTLLDADLWQGMMAEEMIDWQATMFQPIGGMDQIPMAFGRSLGSVVRYGADVREIHKTANGVSVVYFDRKSGKSETVTADYCICAMPLTVLKTVKGNFSPEVEAVIKNASYDSGYKIAWEAPRFWEKEYNIYGGLSYLHQTVPVVWYPSAKLFSETGIIVGGYAVENGMEFGKLPTVQAKLDASRQAIELLHPGHGKDLSKPIYVNWGMIPYNLGSWLSGFGRRGEAIQRLLEPDGRIYFAGDHTSHLVGWQEGAALSAYRVLNQIETEVEKRSSNAA
jgi:monoamine oxidase